MAQHLTMLRIDRSELESRLSAVSPPGALERAQAMRQTVDAASRSTRRLATELRPMMLDELGPAAAIEWLATDFSRRNGIAVNLHMDDPPKLNGQATTAIFRIVQEALTNVARHAQARNVEVGQDATDDTCSLRIADDGCGMLPDCPRRPQSFGLHGIRERVDLLGGRTQINSTPDAAVMIQATLPLVAICMGLSDGTTGG